jgi:hypothetical protein
MAKTLYFEGAGSATAESVAAGVGNCRIRTAFHTADDRRVYLEILDVARGRHNADYWDCKTILSCYVDFAHYITGDSEDCNLRRLPCERQPVGRIPYTLDGILSIVRNCGGDFDAVRVLPDLAGYRVHADDGGYNYGDEFAPDWAAVEKREQIAAECDRLEYAARQRDAETGARKWVNSPSGRIFTNGSVYVDSERANILHWHLCGGESAGDHEIDINAGGTAAECICAAMSWNAATYGDFSAAI